MVTDINGIVKSYFKDEAVTKEVYGYLKGRAVKDVTKSPSKWQRFVHLFKYILHWPGYRAKFNEAANKYLEAHKPLSQRSAVPQPSGTLRSSAILRSTESGRLRRQEAEKQAQIRLKKEQIEEKRRAISAKEGEIDQQTAIIEKIEGFEDKFEARRTLENSLKNLEVPAFVDANFVFTAKNVEFNDVSTTIDTFNNAVTNFEQWKKDNPIKGALFGKKESMEKISKGLKSLNDWNEINGDLDEYQNKTTEQILETKQQAIQEKERLNTDLTALESEMDALTLELEVLEPQQNTEKKRSSVSGALSTAESENESSSSSSVEENPSVILSTPVTVNEVSAASGVALNQATNEFLDLIKENLGDQASQIWRTLFVSFAQGYKEDCCLSLIQEKNGFCTLNLKHPMKLLVKSFDEHGREDPIGGVVLTFGEKNTIRMEIKKNEIKFHKGYETCSRLPLKLTNNRLLSPFKNKLVTAKVIAFRVSKPDQFVSVAQGPMKIEFPRTKTSEEMIKGWGEEAKVIEADKAPADVLRN